MHWSAMFEQALKFANALSTDAGTTLFSRLVVCGPSAMTSAMASEIHGFPSLEVHAELALIVLESLVAFCTAVAQACRNTLQSRLRAEGRGRLGGHTWHVYFHLLLHPRLDGVLSL